jgi:hypothetical protein
MQTLRQRSSVTVKRCRSSSLYTIWWVIVIHLSHRILTRISDLEPFPVFKFGCIVVCEAAAAFCELVGEAPGLTVINLVLVVAWG